MSLTVLDPGLFSLPVDLGRPAARALGVPVGGAADRAAFQLANALLGNPPDAPALEVTLSGPTLRAEHRTAVVVFGAAFSPSVVGRDAVEPGTTFALEPGDVLKVGGTPRGVRGYLCVGGGFILPTILDSKSALEPVKAGDVLACEPSSSSRRRLPFLTLDEPASPTVLHALDGPQHDWFDPNGFFGRPFTVTAASNRMGLRLAGDPVPRRDGEMVSEPVAPGAVQVTNDGRPIVLGVDGQTIGGYPKVAHVVRADLDRLAQLRPGTTVVFERVTEEEAEALAQTRAAVLREWLMRLSMAPR